MVVNVMDQLLSFSLQVGMFAIIPLIFILFERKTRLGFYYAYIGCLSIYANILGSIYSLQITPSVSISGGNIAYTALMMTAMIMFISEREPSVIRNLIIVLIFLNLFYFFLYMVLNKTLENDELINPLGISPLLFKQTGAIVFVGTLLIIFELFFLAFLLEKLKQKVSNNYIISLVYVFLFIFTIVLDGLLFPLILFPFESTLVEMIMGGMEGKLILGSVFSIPIIMFLLIFKDRLKKYIEQPILLKELILRPKEELIRKLKEESNARIRAEIRTQELESLGTLAGGIAHDFNNVLTAVSGNVSLLIEYYNGIKEEINDNVTITSIEESLFSILQSVEIAKGLSNQLLMFAIPKKPNKKSCDVIDLVKSSCKLALTGSNVSSKIQTPYKEKFWMMDNNQIKQVLINLLLNAKQAMPKGGIITITIIELEDNNELNEFFDQIPIIGKNSCAIIIKDDGIGISKKNLKRIYDPYFTTKQSGKGLGLPVCQSIIKFHRGQLYFESKENVGTIVGIFLPYEKNVKKDNVSFSSKKIIKPLNVLVMDDNPIVLSILKKILQKLGCNVDTSTNGEECIEEVEKATIENRSYDIIFLDLTIPSGKGGKEVLDELKEINPKIKTIAISGYHYADIIRNPKKFGFSSSVSKPFTINDIKKAIDEVDEILKHDS